MKNLLIQFVLLIAIGLIAFVNCELVNTDQTNKSKLSSPSASFSALMNNLKQQRSKRRIQDVEKMIIEDELMSLLICDMCEKYACTPNYCKYCSQCTIENNGLKIFSFFIIYYQKIVYFFSDILNPIY